MIKIAVIMVLAATNVFSLYAMNEMAHTAHEAQHLAADAVEEADRVNKYLKACATLYQDATEAEADCQDKLLVCLGVK